jgi:hypothetical protein
MNKREMATELATRRYPFQSSARLREYKRLMAMTKGNLQYTYEVRAGAREFFAKAGA